MKENRSIDTGAGAQHENTDSGAGRRYQSPQLKRLGKLSSVTLGGSPGAGDSGNPLSQEIPNAP